MINTLHTKSQIQTHNEWKKENIIGKKEITLRTSTDGANSRNSQIIYQRK